MLVCALAAGLYSTSRARTYEATARVLLGTTAAQDAVASRININTEVAGRDLVNEINLAESDAIRQDVAAQLGIEVDELPEGKITADLDSDVLNFEFRQGTATRAALIANTWANTYVDTKRQVAQASIDEVVTQLELELADLRQDRDEIRQTLERLEEELVETSDPTRRAALQLRIDREASAISGEVGLVEAQIAANVESLTQLRLSSELAGSAQVFQVAAAPQNPINAPVSRDLAIGTVLGLLLGAGLAIVRDGLDRSIRSADDVEHLGFTVLGRIPKAPRSLARNGLGTIAKTMPGSVHADAYQKVWSAVRFVTIDKDIKTILVTSPHEGDGKTTLSINLAMAYASAGVRVVLVDLDMRRPSIQEYFATPTIPGFSDSLQQDLSLDELAVSIEGLDSTLRVLTAGTCPPDPAAFLASAKLKTVIDRLRSVTDLVLFDAPPTLPVADALSVAPVVDGVIVVGSVGQTRKSQLTDAVQLLQRSGGNVLGVVVNRTAKQKELAYNKLENTGPPISRSDVVPVHPSDLHPRSSSPSSPMPASAPAPAAPAPPTSSASPASASPASASPSSPAPPASMPQSAAPTASPDQPVPIEPPVGSPVESLSAMPPMVNLGNVPGTDGPPDIDPRDPFGPRADPAPATLASESEGPTDGDSDHDVVGGDPFDPTKTTELDASGIDRDTFENGNENGNGVEAGSGSDGYLVVSRGNGDSDEAASETDLDNDGDSADRDAAADTGVNGADPVGVHVNGHDPDGSPHGDTNTDHTDHTDDSDEEEFEDLRSTTEIKRSEIDRLLDDLF